jgi:hypothetical protein
MEKIYLNIAGFTILCQVEDSEQKYHKEKFIKMLRKDYAGFISNKTEKPDFVIKILSTHQVSLEIKSYAKNKNIKNFNILLFHINSKRRTLVAHNPLGSFDFEIAINMIIYHNLLPLFKGFILHGSSIAYKGNSFIFEGRPGAGKSTTAQLLKGLCNILSDDSLIIRKVNNKFYSYQPIVNEKNFNFEKNGNAYLVNKVFFIRKAEECAIKEIKNKNLILQKLIRQVFNYDNKVKLQFPVIAEFVNKTDFYYLYVKKDKKIFKEFFKNEVLKNEI